MLQLSGRRSRAVFGSRDQNDLQSPRKLLEESRFLNFSCSCKFSLSLEAESLLFISAGEEPSVLPSFATGQQGQLAERCEALVLRQLPGSTAVPTLGAASSPCSDKGPLHEQVCLSFLPWGWIFLLLAGEQGALAVAPALPWMAQGGPWQ